MMIMWKKELERYEKDQNWPVAIQLLEQVIRKNPSLVEAYVRMIYILHSIFIEQWCKAQVGENDGSNNIDATQLRLHYYFETSYKKFTEDAEYLFFMGRIICDSEKDFGVSDAEFGLKMLAKACEKEPENNLYKWAYFLSLPQQMDETKAHKLACYLYCHSAEEIKWLKSKGYPGERILNSLQWSYEKYLDGLAINKYVVAPHILLISDFINGILPIKTFNEYYANMVVGQKHPLADKIAEVIQSLLKDVQACQEQLSGRETEASGAETLKSHAEKTLIELKILQVAPQ